MESSKEDWKDGGGRESPNVAKAGPNEQACYGLLKTRFGCLYVGQTVTYSVQPLLQNGLGMATRSGILTVGHTIRALHFPLSVSLVVPS